MESNSTDFYNLRALSFLSWLGILVPIYMFFADKPYVSEDLLLIYALGKGVTVLGSIMVLISIKMKIRSQWQMRAAMFILLFYAVYGQIFIPSYYIAYMQISVALGLFFPIPRKEFYIFSGVGAILMICSILFSEQIIGQTPYLIQEEPQLLKYNADIIIAILIMSAISVAGHHYFSIARMEKDLLSRKFIDVGRNASFVLHDFKGMLLSPSSYIQLLNDTKDELDEDQQEILELLKNDFNFLKKYAIEINQMSANVNMHEKTLFKISETVDELKTIFSNKISSGSSIDISQDGEILFNKLIIKKVLYNLFVNSFEAVQGKDAKITVNLDKNILTVKDNGEGFPDKVLKNLNKGKLISSSKSQGSSIGTLIIRDLIDTMNAKIHFSNSSEGGACIKITLPEKSVVESSKAA